MAKIMLVEDDNNLRQIYEDRLAAEGYEIVSAKDGEEALALAVKQRPDLIIADIMMPRVSGFDMLDILRSTPETKDAKIVMMTALSQAEDKTRAEKLGADKYLVKSQVTLEDVVDVAAEMLGDQQAGANLAGTGAVTVEPSTPSPKAQPQTTPPTTANVPMATPPAQASASIPTQISSPSTTEPPMQNDSPASSPQPSISTTPPSEPAQDMTNQTVASDTSISEQPKPAGVSIPVTSPDETTAKPPETQQGSQEPATSGDKPGQSNEKAMTDQIDEFIASNPTLSTSADAKNEENKAEERKQANPNQTNTASDDNTLVAPATALQQAPIPPEPSSAPSAPTPTPKSEQPAVSGAPVIQPQSQETPTIEAKPPNVSEQSKNAMAAVDGLLNDTGPASQPDESDKKTEPDNKYVDPKSTASEGESQSMIHTKRIEPISDNTNSAPDINELLAKETDHGDPTPPPVNSVITPGGGSISPLPGSNVQDAIQGSTKDNKNDSPQSPDNITL